MLRHIESFSNNIVHGVSKGKHLTIKHALLSVGLHNLTGQKKPIQFLAKLGNSASYETVQRIEAAQAELVQIMRNNRYPLPLIPKSPFASVLTFFWWDNYDSKKENMEGGIHTCHGIAFQEESKDSILRPENEFKKLTTSGKKTVKVVAKEFPKVSMKPHKVIRS